MNLEKPSTAPETTSEVRPLGSPSPATNGGQMPLSISNPSVSSRLPRPRGWSRQRKLTTAGCLAVVPLVIITGIVWRNGGLLSKPPFTGPTAVVQKKILQVTVVARGNLESAKNGDIICNVRSGVKGSTNATTIKWLIDNGTDVKKGDTVIILDDSGLQENLKTQNIDTDNAKAAWIAAEEQYRIDEIQAESDKEKALNAR